MWNTSWAHFDDKTLSAGVKPCCFIKTLTDLCFKRWNPILESIIAVSQLWPAVIHFIMFQSSQDLGHKNTPKIQSHLCTQYSMCQCFSQNMHKWSTLKFLYCCPKTPLIVGLFFFLANRFWNILTMQMDSGEMGYAAGTVWEVLWT